MKTAKFKFLDTSGRGGEIWFNIIRDENGFIVGIEEHDQYQGGSLSCPDGLWVDLFLSRVAIRGNETNFKDAFDFIVELGAR